MTSATTVIELLVNRVWYRSEAWIRRSLSGHGDVSPTPSTIRTSPAPSLPHEIVEMIIAHLVYDTLSLRVCTLICYSWYIVAFPYLHYTLYTSRLWNDKPRWPNPLQDMCKLGLLPFIRTLYIRSDANRDAFSPMQFDNRRLHQFSLLTNVRQLTLYHLDIPSFIPEIRRYFGHFSPTVQSLSLCAPHGTRRQIICFIGMFEHLQDLEIVSDVAGFQGETEDDLTLIPLFTPPLQGRLKLTCFKRVGILRGMVDLFGGIRFHMMDLFEVEGVPFLLDACARTLTTLQLYPCDRRGRQLSLKTHTNNNQRFPSHFFPSNFQSISVQVPANDQGHGWVYRQGMDSYSAGYCLESSQTHALDNRVPFVLPTRGRLSVAGLPWRRTLEPRRVSYTPGVTSRKRGGSPASP